MQKPQFIQDLDAKLQALVAPKLEDGKGFAESYRASPWPTFPLNYVEQVPGIPFSVQRNISASGFAEELTKSVSMSISGLRNVTVEPNGFNTFPDMQAIAGPNSKIYLIEVKSWRSGSRGWAGANVNRFYDAAKTGDTKYFDAWYVDFELTQVGRMTDHLSQAIMDSLGPRAQKVLSEEADVLARLFPHGSAYQFTSITVGKLWDFCDGDARTGSNPGYRSNRAVPLHQFMHNAFDVSFRGTDEYAQFVKKLKKEGFDV